MANRFYIRKFFNRPGYHSTGFIYGYVAKTTNRRSYLDATLTLGDCSRQITLDFDHDKRGRKNTMYKLDTIIEALTKFKEALLTEYEAIDQREEAERVKREARIAAGEEQAPTPYYYSPAVTEDKLQEVLTSDEFMARLRKALRDE